MSHTNAFSGGDAVDLGASYGNNTFGFLSGAKMGVSSGRAIPSGNAYGESHYLDESYEDVDLSVVLGVQVTSGGDWGLSYRVESPGSTAAFGYRISVFPGTSVVQITRVDASPATRSVVLGSNISQAFSAGDVLRVLAVGSSHKVFRAPSSDPTTFTELAERTDATYSGPGLVGLYAYNNSGTGALDDLNVAEYSPGAPPENTVAPAVTGTETQGETLTCSTGTWDGSPSGYTYQWQRDTGGGFDNIDDEDTSIYLLAFDDVGADVRCVVTATNGVGSTSSNSNSVGPIQAAAGDGPPENTILPAISGLPVEGDPLTCSTGSWSPAATSYAYQWKTVSGGNIADADEQTFTITVAEVGEDVFCTVAATNDDGSDTADSEPVTPVALLLPWTDSQPDAGADDNWVWDPLGIDAAATLRVLEDGYATQPGQAYGEGYWTGRVFGAYCEVWALMGAPVHNYDDGGDRGVALWNEDGFGYRARAVEIGGTIQIDRVDGPDDTVPVGDPFTQAIAPGETLGLIRHQDGERLVVYHIDDEDTWTLLGSVEDDTYQGPWNIGLWQYDLTGSARITTLGGGTVPTSPPENATPPAILGAPLTTVTLTTQPGEWNPNGTRIYQWRRDGSPIDGATDPTYLLVEDDESTEITIVETATNAWGQASEESSAVTPEAPAGGATAPDCFIKWDGELIPSKMRLKWDGELIPPLT